ncbi:MAG: hypothetical protein H6649_00825 [Caldilineae bacterium]|nr:hypothetical protein [Anaerolineae bacterium]MCB9152587.1 hypothetical protein [Caldilineae bacterium]
MKKRLWQSIALILVFVALVAVPVYSAPATQPQPAAGGPITPLNPDDQALTADQMDAQSLAIADARVQAELGAGRTEVFEVFPLFGPYPAEWSACSTGACYQVDIYNFDSEATVTAIVDQATGQVLDVWHTDGVFPLVNKRLYNRAVEIIQQSPDVEAALGFVPEAAQIRLMDQIHMDSQCDGDRLCAGATFYSDSGALWVLVDLVDEKIEKIWWSDRPVDMSSALYNPKPEREPEDCGTTIHVARDGWNLDYRTTPTDALEITSVTYNVDGVDRPVATRMKLVEWHAHYPSGFGYRDYTGCGGGGGGFAIYPYGNTQVLDINSGDAVIGFEVVQDFRMSNWGNSCNYRYEQHFQFFDDGRFRVVTGAYGQGCGNNQLNEATYRPVVRIDIAVNGDDNDSFAVWDGATWADQTTEAWWLQEAPYTAEGYRYRVTDQSGVGYYIEPGQGQFGDGGTGDNAYMYLTQHHASEGDSDMPLLPNTGCCNNNYMQGPQSYIDGESTTDQNIVLWYVPQSETITTWAVQNGYGDAQYCWTDNTSNYWPCFSGPMFVPIPESPPTAVSLSTLAANDGLEPTQGGFTLVLVLAAGLSMAIATGFLLRRRNLAAQQASNVLDRH